MKKRIEFPLFEAMIIIILLSVLALFAFPKFVDIGIEARIKTLNATVLSLSSVNRMLYSRALIKGVQNNALQTTDILGEKDAGAYLVYGEIRATEEDLAIFLESDLIEYSKTNRKGVIRLFLDSFKSDKCYVEYQQAKQRMIPDGKTKIIRATYKVKATGC